MPVCLDKASPKRSPAESCRWHARNAETAAASIDVQRECARCFPQGAIMNHTSFVLFVFLSYRDERRNATMPLNMDCDAHLAYCHLSG